MKKKMFFSVFGVITAALLINLTGCPQSTESAGMRTLPDGSQISGVFTKAPEMTFEPGNDDGKISYSWTAAAPESGVQYRVYIIQATETDAGKIISAGKPVETSNDAGGGTYNGIEDVIYSAVTVAVKNSDKAYSAVKMSWAKTSEYDLRFGVISDTHIGDFRQGALSVGLNYSLHARLEKALKWYTARPGVQALAVNGDMTEYGFSEEWDIFRSTWDTHNKRNLRLIAVMGNHDTYAYEDNPNEAADKFEAGAGQKTLAHYVLNGYHFIVLNTGSGDVIDTKAHGGAIATARAETPAGGDTVGPEIREWARERIDFAKQKAPNKPIFVFLHHPIRNTFYVSNEWNTSSFGATPETYEFKDDPEVVIFGGHIHSPNNEPRSIWQGGFTSVNVPSLHYMELEKGYLGNNVSGTGNSTYPKMPNPAYGQGLIVSVKGTKVTIENYDFDFSEGPTPLENVVQIPQTWEFDVTDSAIFPYTNAKRDAQKTAPVFVPAAPTDAISGKITVKSVTSASVEVEFTQAVIPDPNPGNEVVHSYRFDFINQTTGAIDRSAKQWSDFMLTPRLQKPTYTQLIGGLTADTDYELRIYAYSSFQDQWNKFLQPGGQPDQCSAQYLIVEFQTKP